MICNDLQKCINEQLHSATLKKCNNDKDRCIESSDKRSSVKCEERGKKYVYENTRKKHVISYQMDGGVIVEDETVPPNINKCDYLFVVNDTELTAILTELKGVSVAKSLDQIKGTISLYKGVFDNFKRVYARVVVRSSTPNLKATPAYTNLEKLLRQKYHGNIKIAEKQFRERDIDLDSR